MKKSKFVFKGDDDILLIPENLINLLSELPPTISALGNYKRGEQINHDMSSKYFMPTELYEGYTYPGYFSGAAYIFTASFAHKVANKMESYWITKIKKNNILYIRHNI